MTNNDILKKLRVALRFRDEDIIDVLQLVDFKITKSELGAFFRKEDHPNYRECGDQVLRNFLNGLVIQLRGSKENPKIPGEVLLKMTAPKKVHADKAKLRPKPEVANKPKPKQDLSYVKYKNKKKS